MVHEFHDPLFCPEVCRYDPSGRVTLDELWEVEASNSQSPRLTWGVQYSDENPENLQKGEQVSWVLRQTLRVLSQLILQQSSQCYQMYVSYPR